MCFTDSGRNRKEQMGNRPHMLLLFLHQKIHNFHLWRCYRYMPIYLILHWHYFLRLRKSIYYFSRLQLDNGLWPEKQITWNQSWYPCDLHWTSKHATYSHIERVTSLLSVPSEDLSNCFENAEHAQGCRFAERLQSMKALSTWGPNI